MMKCQFEIQQYEPSAQSMRKCLKEAVGLPDFRMACEQAGVWGFHNTGMRMNGVKVVYEQVQLTTL